jgi:ATP-binding cassette subfamily B protein
LTSVGGTDLDKARTRAPRWWKRSIPDIGPELWHLVLRYRGAVLSALACLVLAKIATVLVPVTLKRIIDMLGQPARLVALPVALLAGYALLRFAGTLFNELRDLLFAPLAQHTVAHYAQRTFAHLHQLGARFHAQRQLGGLLPDIDRGTSGLAFLLGTGVFTLVPTLFEIGLVLVIVLAQFSAWFAVIISVTFVAYGAYTLLVTSRRTTYQRRVNKLDSSAKTRLADSLINYENALPRSWRTGAARRCATSARCSSCTSGRAPSSVPASRPSCCLQATKCGAA